MRSIGVTLGLAALALGGGTELSPGGADVSAAHWELDPAFGSGGVVTTDFPGSGHRYSWGYDSAEQPNGRTDVLGVAAGQLDDAAVARYLPDGEFVVGGGPFTGAASVSMDPSGRLVMAGIYGDPNQVEGADRFALMRMRPSGERPGVGR